MENLESFIRDIALKQESSDPISNEFFKIISKSFRRITSNSFLQSRLVEEAIVYSIGIVMELIDPNLKFKQTLDIGLSNYIETEPFVRKRTKTETDLVRLAVVRVAYYIVFLKIAFDDELVTQDRTNDISIHFEHIFQNYISQETVTSDTRLTTEDFLQKIKFIYKQAYRQLPGVYIPANLFLSVSLIDFSDFENKEWRYYLTLDNLEKCLNILSTSRLRIERTRLLKYIRRCMPEMFENYTTSQMNLVISLYQENKLLNNQCIELRSRVEAHTLRDSYNSIEELLSNIHNLQRKLSEMTLNKLALESINNSLRTEIANLQQTISELLRENNNLKRVNDDQKKELENINSQNNKNIEKPDPLSYYIKDQQLLKKTVNYAESEECTKKILFYKYIYRNLRDHGISMEILRSSEFLRAIIPHLIHLRGINAHEIRRQDILSLQQTIRVNDTKHL